MLTSPQKKAIQKSNKDIEKEGEEGTIVSVVCVDSLHMNSFISCLRYIVNNLNIPQCTYIHIYMSL